MFFWHWSHWFQLRCVFVAAHPCPVSCKETLTRVFVCHWHEPWRFISITLFYKRIFNRERDIVEWTHLNHISLNPTKTNYMILTTRQKRQILNSPSAHIMIGKQQRHEVSEHKFLGVTIDNNLTWGPQTRHLCKSAAKRVYQSAKFQNFLTFHARKTFFQAHIQSCIDYASTLWDSASESLLKPLKSLHRRAIRIVLLKHTSLTNEDYKNTTLLPLKPRLMCKKARFMHKILSGKAPTYLLEKVSINHYSRNCSRKLNVPMPRLDLFKSSLIELSGIRYPLHSKKQLLCQFSKLGYQNICYLPWV